MRLCADALAGSAAFDRLASPSSAHLLAPSLRSDASRACLWGSTRSALANSLHGASHRRTASGNCSLGATPYRKKYIPSGPSYRERNRLRKPPARTQGRCGRSSVLVHNSGAFGTPERLSVTVGTTLVVNAVINMDINQSLKESSISQQPAVNKSSNSHQSDVKSSTFSSRS